MDYLLKYDSLILTHSKHFFGKGNFASVYYMA